MAQATDRRFDALSCLLGHVATGVLLAFGLYSESSLWMWFALVPWASVLDKGGLAATIAGSTFAGTLVGLVGYEFVLIHPYPGALIKAVWVAGSIFFSGLSWMAGTLVSRWLIRRGIPRLLSMLAGWFTFELCLRYLSAVLVDGGILFLQFGASQRHYPIVQIASVAGLTGIGIFIVVINSLVLTIGTALLTRSAEKLRAAAITCALIGGVLTAVSVGIPKPENAMILKVGVVNIPLFAQDENAFLTNKIPELDLVVFGEGGFLVARPNFITMPKYSPGVQDSESGPMKLLWELSKRFNAPIIIGAERWWGGDGPFRFNSVVLATPTSGVHQAYDKQWLTAEAEARPRLLRFTDRLLGRAPKITVQWGTESDPFVLPDHDVRIGMSICHDLYFEQPFHDYMKHAGGPIDLLVNCAGHEGLGDRVDALAMRHARFRAIETGRPIVHVAIAGTSCGFDSVGNEFFRIENTEADGDLRVFAVPLASRKTLFSQTGRVVTDVVLMLFLIGSIRIYRGRLEKGEFCQQPKTVSA